MLTGVPLSAIYNKTCFYSKITNILYFLASLHLQQFNSLLCSSTNAILTEGTVFLVSNTQRLFKLCCTLLQGNLAERSHPGQRATSNGLPAVQSGLRHRVVGGKREVVDYVFISMKPGVQM